MSFVLLPRTPPTRLPVSSLVYHRHAVSFILFASSLLRWSCARLLSRADPFLPSTREFSVCFSFEPQELSSPGRSPCRSPLSSPALIAAPSKSSIPEDFGSSESFSKNSRHFAPPWLRWIMKLREGILPIAAIDLLVRLIQSGARAIQNKKRNFNDCKTRATSGAIWCNLMHSAYWFKLKARWWI